MTAALLGGAFLWLGVATPAQAHGMRVEFQASASAVVVECTYSNGDPADVEVLVYSPAEVGRIFQRLRTDIRGFASFVPDAAGTWRVVADDGMGHRTELDLSVGSDAVSVRAERRSTWRSAISLLGVPALLLAIWWAWHAKSGAAAGPQATVIRAPGWRSIR